MSEVPTESSALSVLSPSFGVWRSSLGTDGHLRPEPKHTQDARKRVKVLEGVDTERGTFTRVVLFVRGHLQSVVGSSTGYGLETATLLHTPTTEDLLRFREQKG